MRKFIFEISLISIVASMAAAQDPGYYCIYGNRDGSTIDVYIGLVRAVHLHPIRFHLRVTQINLC
jgi:hypothetical protein